MDESARDLEQDLALCEKATPGPVKWQKFGKQYYLTGQYGIRPIIFATTNAHTDHCTYHHISNRDAENDLLIPLSPDHPDSKFVEEAWEALPYWLGEAERLRAVLSDIYPAIAGHVIALDQAGETVAHERWAEMARKIHEVLEVRNG